MGRDFNAEAFDHQPVDISIHAPRMGRDSACVGAGTVSRLFQSTRPAWGATDIFFLTAYIVNISIHAPRMGRDHTADA